MTRQLFFQIYNITEEQKVEDILFVLVRTADNQQMFNLRLSITDLRLSEIPMSTEELLNHLRCTAEDFFFSVYRNG